MKLFAKDNEFMWPSICAEVHRRAQVKARKYNSDEDGAVMPLVLILFTLMIVSTGMAVDFMRHETARADLQNALDRAVLAAADLDQSMGETLDDKELLISGYMESRSFYQPLLTLDVNQPDEGAGRIIEASASYDLETFFLKIMGIRDMTISASARAEDGTTDLEVMLILDVSLSMATDSSWNRGNSRLDDLKEAATEFVDHMLNDDTAENVAISILPYSMQVTVPNVLADAYNLDRHHDFETCFNFDPLDYQDAFMDPSALWDQGQHFGYGSTTVPVTTNVPTSYTGRFNGFGFRQRANYTTTTTYVTMPDDFLCPNEINEALIYSNDPDDLYDKIEDLDYESNTAIYTGMKWAATLVDPNSRSVIQHLIDEGEVDDVFTDWPHDHSDSNTQKVIVLMTDGRNTSQTRANQSVYETETPEYWDENPFPSYGVEYEVSNSTTGDAYLLDICDAAKQSENTIIYTIGFELSTDADAAAVLEDCASSLSTHYMVEAVNIDLAFDNIASQVQTLKLTN